MLTDFELIELLKQRCAGRKQKVFAREHDISPQFVTDVLKGRKDMTARLAAALGYKPAERQWEPITSTDAKTPVSTPAQP